MVKTVLEWYTLEEKLPFDGECFGEKQYAEVLAYIRHDWNTVETFRYINNKFVIYINGEEIDFTDTVIYWAYVPMIKEE